MVLVFVLVNGVGVGQRCWGWCCLTVLVLVKIVRVGVDVGVGQCCWFWCWSTVLHCTKNRIYYRCEYGVIFED